MKSFIFVAIFLCGAALVRSDKADLVGKWQKIMQECKVEEGASDEDLVPFVKRSKLETVKSKCVLACVNEKMGYMGKDGTVNLAKISEMSSQYYTDPAQSAIWTEVTTTCSTKVPTTDRCERANDYIMCIAGEISNKGLDPHAFFI